MQLVIYFREWRTINLGDNQLAGNLLSFGYHPSLRCLKLEHNQMSDSIADELYKSLITEFVGNLLSGEY